MPIDDTQFQTLKKTARSFIQKQENDECLREDFLNSLLALPLTIEQRIALLAEQDKEGWTVGMTVVRYHRETAVQQYLVHHSIILGELHQDGKDVLLALALLMKKTATGWTLGHYIAYYESNQIVQQYIALLIHLHQAEVSGHNIMELFKLQMDNGWTVGHLIARHHDAATVQTYLKLLNTLLVANDWLEGVALAQDILALFKLRTKDGWTIIYPVGCQIARNHDVATLQVYFKLLSDLLAADAPAQKILALLELQTDRGWTVELQIASTCSATTVQAYLKLLNDLLTVGAPAQNILELFKLQTNDGWNVGLQIASTCGATTVRAYLKLLNDLLTADAPVQHILALFKLQTNDGWTVGHLIARHHDAATVQAYFKLLNDLLTAGAPAQNILELFKLQTDSGWTIGHLNAAMNSYYREIEEEIKVNQKYASTHFHGASFFSAEFTKKFSSSYPKRNPLSPKKRCSINSVDPLAQSKSESEAFLLDLKKDTHIFSL